MPPPGLFGYLIQNKRRQLWEKKEGVDATLLVDDVRLGVHSMILGAESASLQSRFQASLRESGVREICIEEADIHTVWRTLMLIYVGYYSTSPCPKTATPGAYIHIFLIPTCYAERLEDTLRDESLHASVYFLSRCWGLSKSLQKLALQNCTAERRRRARYTRQSEQLKVLNSRWFFGPFSIIHHVSRTGPSHASFTAGAIISSFTSLYPLNISKTGGWHGWL